MKDEKGKSEELKKRVGQRIKEIRHAFGFSQQELADKADLTQSAIAQFERGDRLPSTTALQGIAQAFGISMESLLSDESGKTSQAKEALLEKLMNKARILSQEDIVTLNRLVEKFRPEEEGE